MWFGTHRVFIRPQFSPRTSVPASKSTQLPFRPFNSMDIKPQTHDELQLVVRLDIQLVQRKRVRHVDARPWHLMPKAKHRHYPFTQTLGTSRATRRAKFAASVASATSSTSL